MKRVTGDQIDSAGQTLVRYAYNDFGEMTITGTGTAVSKEATGSAPKCFVAGTLIAVEEGRQPIEEIKIGQLVYSENPETGEKGLRKLENCSYPLGWKKEGIFMQ